MYKVAMQIGNTEKWNIMDQDKSQKKMLTSMAGFRKMFPDKKFRLELHTMEVIDA